MWLTIIILILLIISTVLYSRFIGTSGIKVKEYKVETSITDNFYGLKIVHITDLHYGRTINKKELLKIVTKINMQKPDLVLLTGDLIDRDTKMTVAVAQDIIGALQKIDVTIGKYAIEGNHDYAFKNWSTIITGAGFTNLNDNYDLIYKDTLEPIIVAGISSNLKNRTTMTTKMEKVNTYFSALTEESIRPVYGILLIHEPDYIDNLELANFDLILAGHSHNGQVRLPLIGPLILPDGSKKYFDSYYKVGNSDMYISSGLGTSVLDLRLFNRPSFNLYRITN